MFTALDIAITQLGVRELTGTNDGIPADRYMRGDKLAWCAGFVMWCFDQSDQPSFYAKPNDWWRLRSVEAMEADLKKRGLWMGWAIKPQPGDIIFFANRGRSDAGSGRHVGLVERVGGGYVYTVEGNLSDSVKRARHPRGSGRITGYARIS